MAARRDTIRWLLSLRYTRCVGIAACRKVAIIRAAAISCRIVR
ncbi:unnamed protein product [Periconia digitata]|uniref:Uncharacterized protein n=1 Tax=Periconia digitata TaxID=1303443 RepID=A0A9W4UIU1_9PLEO|nr:unnamed protein product [Periconia digitata]